MNKVPKDPLTKLDYSYAAIGTSTLCTSVHIGTSLGDKTNRALLSGADAPAKGASFLCTGSLPDFSGLSYAVAGQPCNATAGTPQPTNAANGETCYDVI